jgi:hypothetical protein
MRLVFALLLMTTTLGIGSALLAAGRGLPFTPDAGVTSRSAPGADLTLIDDDEDEDGGWPWSSSDDDDACEDDDDEGGDDCTAGAVGNAAKAGSAPPPKNGLFTDGTAPVVKSN